MRNKLFTILMAASLLTFFGQRGFCADKTDATAEFRELWGKIEAKMMEGKRAEKDFGEELKEFDRLLTLHKDEKTEGMAGIFLWKAVLFMKVFGDAEKGVALVKQLKSDFPATEVAKNADAALAEFPILYNGKNPPSVAIILKSFLRCAETEMKSARILGLHKEREGAYLVIVTNRDLPQWGGPYTLLRLESNNWVIREPASLHAQYVFIMN